MKKLLKVIACDMAAILIKEDISQKNMILK